MNGLFLNVLFEVWLSGLGLPNPDFPNKEDSNKQISKDEKKTILFFILGLCVCMQYRVSNVDLSFAGPTFMSSNSFMLHAILCLGSSLNFTQTEKMYHMVNRSSLHRF